ncbi:3-keto-disaccharide hydrolase [Wenyingzhuangia sp. IMCC45574]
MSWLLLVFVITSSGFTQQKIFNGKNLKGWHLMENTPEQSYVSLKENFFVKENTITCKQLDNRKGALILSDKSYADFELELDFKSDWGCDSGIFVRTDAQGRGLQILNDFLKDGCIGHLFSQGAGAYISRPIRLYKVEGKVVAKDMYDGEKRDKLNYSINAKKWNVLWKQDNWNHIKIRCVGNKPMLTTWVNGVKIMELDGSKYEGRQLIRKDGKWQGAGEKWNQKEVQAITKGKGMIGLQIHPGGRWKKDGVVQYKNIKVKEL